MLVESGKLGIQFWESEISLTIGFQDLSSIDKESGIQSLESGIHNSVESSRIQDRLGLPKTL